MEHVKRPWRAAALWCLACMAGPAAWAVPSYDEVRGAHRPSETLVLSREGEVLQRLRTDASVRRGEWVALQDISPALRNALVLSEDQRFYEHSGVDWSAVSSAAWGRLWHQRTRGASTISMQLAGLTGGAARAGARWCRRSARPWPRRYWTAAGARTRFSRPISTWCRFAASWWA